MSPAPPSLRAFGDESMRVLPGGGALYVLGAAIVPDHRCDEVRALLRGLLLGRRKRLHWRDENDAARRARIVDAVAESGVDSLVVIGAKLEASKQERARRQALRQLLWELDQRAVEHLLLESRHPERDAYDVKGIGGMRNAGVLSRRLRVEHGMPVQEPLLWLPDVVCGVVGDASCGAGGHRAVIESRLTVVEIVLT